ncbi:MAG: GDP-mannose pyrophosphatase NudK [Cyclobacteriaceae bacterium]|nr:GDP-mannose pyrophosphatase NudK [Cytophagales bacterium]HNP78046.1 GDP-mannose pyrophosphatase NudK [Cyclobacteriaceae bacterium]HQQ83488.1 GDP-mannose pyrophosphatase NudK [Cyclobacteriaceae bacterium]
MARQVKILREDILSKNWYTLKKITFEYQEKNGTKHTLTREAYDRGNGATILLYNKARRTVILTRQFRMPTFINGNPDGMLIEACAGLLDLDQPAEAIRRETREETGFQIDHVEKIFEAYMSPGSVTEILYFFVAEYTAQDRKDDGGGIDNEDIDVLELPFEKAMQMVSTGEIKDGKTIMLLYHAQINNLLG